MPDYTDNGSGNVTDKGTANDSQPTRSPRVLAADVNATLSWADLAPLPDSAPRGTIGLKTAQMLDAVLVLCSAPGAAEATAMRDEARRALREGGFMVKDEPGVPGMFYVIGLQ